MKRTFLFVAAVAVISLMSLGTSNSEAKPGPAKSPSIKLSTSKSVHVTFYASSHCGWRQYCYYPSCRCYLFFDPITGQWYFWCDRLGRFLPISYLTAYPPTTNGAALLPPGTIPTPVNTGTPTNTGTPSLPPGATPLPNDPMQPAGTTLP